MSSFSDSISTEILEARMRPGILSQEGFLGENESLEEVLTRDARTLEKIGLTHKELADKLGSLIKVALDAPGNTVRAGNFYVRVVRYRGFQICPWARDIHHAQCDAGGGVEYGSVDWRIRNLRTGQEMFGPGLIVHLIREHNFFEGFESTRRIDPGELARLLEMGRFSNMS